MIDLSTEDMTETNTCRYTVKVIPRSFLTLPFDFMDQDHLRAFSLPAPISTGGDQKPARRVDN